MAGQTFRSEFINRIDRFIIFLPLDAKQIYKCVEIQVDLRYTKGAVELLATLGFDPNSGVRLVKREIQLHIVDKVAIGVMKGDFKREESLIVTVEESTSAIKKLHIKKLDLSDAIFDIQEKIYDHSSYDAIDDSDWEMSLSFAVSWRNTMMQHKALFKEQIAEDYSNCEVHYPPPRILPKLKPRKINLHYTKGVELLGKLELNPNFSAWRINSIIQQLIENEIAMGLRREDFKEGDSIMVDVDESPAAKYLPARKKICVKKLDRLSEAMVDSDWEMINYHFA
ncbi:hypothetical protein Dsin_016069 [Dipteronia sinensis]|uniref:Clp ATPase C-terminal domain-containing protein n=1 Tax=Dipteronia sinensis TaxID=43782 RepID=A0AAE0ADB9_9ROSI|nr:hypothetical protein Dsin_016069 [Dipteronia sinensis]